MKSVISFYQQVGVLQAILFQALWLALADPAPPTAFLSLALSCFQQIWEGLQCSNQVPASIPALLQAQENQISHHELQQKHTKLQIAVLNIQIVSWQISWILASTVDILHSEMPRSFDRFVNNKSNHQSYLHNRPINFVLETKRNIINLILYLSVGFDPFSLYGLTRTRASQK